MARNEREKRDFLSVEYFSQLPFLRPVPPSKQKGRGSGSGSGSGSAIRLFGQDVGNNSSSGGEGEASSRRFECHYCCRNFPTSQALGGHQNAHKRERQNAKRAHFQSVMSVDTHDYRMMNYGRVGSLPPPHAAAARPLYNGHLSQPISGSPLGMWRIPAAENPSLYSQERVSLPLPIHRQIPLDEQLKPLVSVSSLPSQNRFVFESKPSIRDHVSLDLHL